MSNHRYDQNQQWQTNRYTNEYSRYSRISIDDAMSIALERVSGEVVKAKLDTADGLLIYEVDIINRQGVKYEVEINAQTGEIIKLERD